MLKVVNKKKAQPMPPLEKVQADLAAGMTRAQMAEAYNVDPRSVNAFLARHKIRTRREIKYPSDEEILAGLNAGESVRALSIRFGVNKESLWRRIYDHRLRDRVQPPPPPPPPEPPGPKPSAAKMIVTALDGSRISVPRIPTIHGKFEART